MEAFGPNVVTSRVICALSGGVRPPVPAVLVHRVVGDRLTNIFVNTCLLRKNEFEHPLEMLRDRLALRVIGVAASDRFLPQLKGVADPERKRKLIAADFIHVSADKALDWQKSQPHQAFAELVQ